MARYKPNKCRCKKGRDGRRHCFKFVGRKRIVGCKPRKPRKRRRRR